jgi:hypothetical protein
MPVIISMLWGGLASILSTLVGRVLIALSIGYVSYSGIDILLDSMKSAAYANLGNMGPLVGVVGLLKISESLNVVISAVIAKYTIQGLTGGTITKMVLKK